MLDAAIWLCSGDCSSSRISRRAFNGGANAPVAYAKSDGGWNQEEGSARQTWFLRGNCIWFLIRKLRWISAFRHKSSWLPFKKEIWSIYHNFIRLCQELQAFTYSDWRNRQHHLNSRSTTESLKEFSDILKYTFVPRSLATNDACKVRLYTSVH